MAATIGPRLAPSAHIKDIVVEPDLVLKIAEVPPGHGIMDLDGVLESCRHLPDDSSLIVEHFGPERVRGCAALRRASSQSDTACSGALTTARS